MSIKFETETEEFLYNERKQFLEERDKARKELQSLKDSIKKDTFSVVKYNILSEEDQLFNHPTYKAKLIITKGACTLTLEGDEIIKVVKSAGGNFKR